MQNIDTSALAAAKAKLDAAEAQREEVLLRHIANGVDIRSRNVEIGSEVVIAPGAVILAGTILRGKTAIGAGCVIGPNTLIEDSTVDEGTTVNASQVYSSHLGPHNNIGPFTHVRINTVTGYGVHLGAYVETKNSNFARGNTVSHLTYIGDSDVGKYCNFGCGTVTCNFDAIYALCDSANEMLDRKMAEYAAAVCHDRPTFHISLVQDISPNCDCHGENDAPILPDIGMFASFDPVALDQTCADACLNAAPLPNSQLGQNLATPGWNCHHDNFKDSNPNIEWKATLEQAEKVGMGTRAYTLKKV